MASEGGAGFAVARRGACEPEEQEHGAPFYRWEAAAGTARAVVGCGSGGTGGDGGAGGAGGAAAAGGIAWAVVG